jgi:hypothetical protein
MAFLGTIVLWCQRRSAGLLAVLLIWSCVAQLALAPVAHAVDNVTGAITITGSVPPKPTTVTVAVAANVTSVVKQDDVITYTITYGSLNSAAVPITFQAVWDKGTVEGASDPTVETASYVIGSATTAYGGAAPVVDIFNKTITWSISSFPANTQNQTVSFQLKTSQGYTGDKTVTFPVIGRITSPTGVPDKTVTTSYRYATPSTTQTTSSDATPTPSATPVTVSTPANAGTTALATPGDGSDSLVVSAISIQAVGAQSAKIGIQLSKPGNASVVYGVSPGSLYNSGVTLNQNSSTITVALTQLQPASTYYFRVDGVATDTGVVASSDIFALQTAAQQPQAYNAPAAVTLSQNRATLMSQNLEDELAVNALPVIITKNSVVDVNLNIPNSQEVSTVTAGIRVPGVLGAETEDRVTSDDFSSVVASLTKIGQSMYAGKLRTPNNPGTYEIIGWVEDVYGNFSEFPLGNIKVVSPFTIIDASTKKPIEHVQVVLSLYNNQTKLYETISNIGFLDNPSYTDAAGVIGSNLFPGKYQAAVTMAGYQPQTVVFDVGTADGELPTILLQRSPTILGGRAEYLYGAFTHYLNQELQFFSDLAGSEVIYEILLVIIGFFLTVFVGALLFLRAYPKAGVDFVPHGAPTNSYSVFIKWIVFFVLQTARFFIEVIVVSIFFFSIAFYTYMPLGKALLLLVLSTLQLATWMALYIATRQRGIAQALAELKTSRSQSSSK